jgi:hypothetical protein
MKRCARKNTSQMKLAAPDAAAGSGAMPLLLLLLLAAAAAPAAGADAATPRCPDSVGSRDAPPRRGAWLV